MSERRSIVVTHRMGYKYWLIGVLVTVALSFLMLGKWWGQAELAGVLEERQELASKLNMLAVSSDLKSKELETVRLNAEVDSAALENTRQEMIVLQKNINRNEEQLGIYKELLGDVNQPSGLSIAKFDLTPLDQGRFAYSWVARQKTSKMKMAEIVADISILGSQGDQVTAVLLSDLDDELEKMPIRLKFKYFSINQGILSLPVGFNPDKVRITLRYSWSKAVNYDQNFNWVEEA
ncbi:hypothetical protein OAK26_01800 [Gammaproteobacteria bacterium]|nr:hypothetical protein [Gammaproteobacteria bacterium]